MNEYIGTYTEKGVGKYCVIINAESFEVAETTFEDYLIYDEALGYIQYEQVVIKELSKLVTLNN